MEKEHTTTQMRTYMMEIGKMTRNVDMGAIFTKRLKKGMKGIGRTIKERVKANFISLMEDTTKEISFKEKKTGKV